MDSAAKGHRKARARNTPAQRLFDVDCKLSYILLDDTHFLFLVRALDGMDQEVLEESLRITPVLEQELHADAVLGHRTLRLKAPTGPLTLRYRARVRLYRPPPNTRAQEVPIEALPHAVLADLIPTRYCESDRLASAASSRRRMRRGCSRCPRARAIETWCLMQSAKPTRSNPRTSRTRPLPRRSSTSDLAIRRTSRIWTHQGRSSALGASRGCDRKRCAWVRLQEKNIGSVLRPILVGKDTKLPDYVVLISTIGGMALFGINGFVIGPVIAVMFIAVWGILQP